MNENEWYVWCGTAATVAALVWPQLRRVPCVYEIDLNRIDIKFVYFLLLVLPPLPFGGLRRAC